MSLVLWAVFVFLNAELLVRLAHREYEQQCIGRTWDKGEQFRFVDTEDIMECKFLGETKLVD